MEKIEKYNDHLLVYTDASKTLNGTASAAFCVPSLKVEHSMRLTNHVTIYADELTAILIALIWIKHNENEPGKSRVDEPVLICSDSLSSLTSLNTGKSKNRPNLLTEVREQITLIKTEVKFLWVPSHIGVPGNVRVDELANDATGKADIELNIRLEKQEANALVEL